jgi:saccharopine dehydrogenase-like NADP-dependent oxidoreductase
MKDVVVIGAGKIGATVAGLLASTGDYQVTLADRSPEALGCLDRDERIRVAAADVEDSSKLIDLLNGQFAVLNAAPFHLTTVIAEAARAAHTHYLDLTEDVASMRRVRELAADASAAFIPQCGLAPGFVSVVAFDMAKRFEVLDSVKLRVGALPQYPSNALNYNLTWSTDGVINEYCEPCEAIVNGVRREVPPLEEREEFSLDGVTYEAFNTSGGLGTLCDTLEGKVRTLNYRTIRYPGHAVIMRALLNDLRLRDRRDVLKNILEHAVPTTLQDVVIIFVTVSGRNNGQLIQETYANKIYSRDVDGRTLSAIQITTAAAICTVLDLIVSGQLPPSGFVRQEDISLKVFLENDNDTSRALTKQAADSGRQIRRAGEAQRCGIRQGICRQRGRLSQDGERSARDHLDSVRQQP